MNLFTELNTKMRITINKKELTIFKGAKLLDAVRAYSRMSAKKLESGYLALFDRYGFRTESDGPAREGGHYYLRVAGKSKT